MSIAKPTLTNAWASSGAANIADPGGVNETGIPSAAKSIPRRWFNWVLNKVDATGRYLVARGIPDYDPLESYSIGDRVQRAGVLGAPDATFVCIQANDSSAPKAPIDFTTYWRPWATDASAVKAVVSLSFGSGWYLAKFGEFRILIETFPMDRNVGKNAVATTHTFSSAFPTACLASIPVMNDGTPVPCSINSLSSTQVTVIPPVVTTVTYDTAPTMMLISFGF